MNTLFIDTHDTLMRVALINTKVYEVSKESTRGHSEIVMPSIIELLDKAGIKKEEINEIAVVNGPGSFTGVRIGTVIAKTIAYSLNIQVKTITSLEMYGVSCKEKFDLICLKDAKGVYYTDSNYANFGYLKFDAFNEYIEKNNLSIVYGQDVDYEKIMGLLNKKNYTDAFVVNPVYIKEIDVLK